MWVDFRIAHIIGCSLFMIFLYSNYGENSKKIPTGHELNQVVK